MATTGPVLNDSGNSTPILKQVEGTFTPTVTLVGGAGNTVPTYVTNNGRYVRIGRTVFVDVWLDGNGGTAGAGTGTLNVDLPIAASASHDTDEFPAGMAKNSTTPYLLLGVVAPSATTVALYRNNAAAVRSPLDGVKQDNATRAIRLKFWYEV